MSSSQKPEQGYLPQAVIDDLKARLHYLEHEARPKNQQDKARAYEEGGIHENGAWEAAVQDQAVIDHEISVLRDTVEKSRPLETLEVTSEVASLGTAVKLLDLEDQELFTLGVVDSVVGFRNTGLELTSLASPLGQQLKGRRVGDSFEVTVNSSIRRYQILSIEVLSVLLAAASSDDQLEP